jgi:hypothetical protein
MTKRKVKRCRHKWVRFPSFMSVTMAVASNTVSCLKCGATAIIKESHDER